MAHKKKPYTTDKDRKKLRQYIGTHFGGSQSDFASAYGTHRQFISAILMGRERMPDSMRELIYD